MLIVVSPAKTLDYDSTPRTDIATQPEYLEHSRQLINRLRCFSPLDIAELMKVSMKIADLNVDRYANWRPPFSPQNARQAILAFKGDVYAGLDTESFDGDDFRFAQDHLRILSGLYGLLRPLDLMQPYRLEMGTSLQNDRGRNLYEFWGGIITDGINCQLQAINSTVLINLASNEYFKSVRPAQVAGKIITPQFKEKKNGEFRMIGIHAKRARGMLSRYIIKHRLSEPEDIKSFAEAGYAFNQALSKGDSWVFTRQ